MNEEGLAVGILTTKVFNSYKSEETRGVLGR